MQIFTTALVRWKGLTSNDTTIIIKQLYYGLNLFLHRACCCWPIFEVLTAMNMKMAVVWDAAPCNRYILINDRPVDGGSNFTETSVSMYYRLTEAEWYAWFSATL
jgi:hypothetical protein